MMKIFYIFALLTISNYAKNTNLKTPLAGCNNYLLVTIGQPFCQGAFNFMKLIPLSQKSKTIAGKYFAMVDDEDYELLMLWNWHVRINNKTGCIYAGRSDKSRNDGKNHTVLMHRQIMKLTDPIEQVDHIDLNGLNNQRSNLRKATQLDNSRNKGKRKGTSSIYRGVNINIYSTRYIRKDGSIRINGPYIKWVSTIRVNRKLVYLGRYTDEIEAAKAYDEAAKKYFGEFANPNFKV